MNPPILGPWRFDRSTNGWSRHWPNGQRAIYLRWLRANERQTIFTPLGGGADDTGRYIGTAADAKGAADLSAIARGWVAA